MIKFYLVVRKVNFDKPNKNRCSFKKKKRRYKLILTPPFHVFKDKDIILWDLDTLEIKNILRGHKSDVTSLCVVKNAHVPLLCSGCASGLILCWNINTSACVSMFEGLAFVTFGRSKE